MLSHSFPYQDFEELLLRIQSGLHTPMRVKRSHTISIGEHVFLAACIYRLVHGTRFRDIETLFGEFNLFVRTLV